MAVIEQLGKKWGVDGFESTGGFYQVFYFWGYWLFFGFLGLVGCGFLGFVGEGGMGLWGAGVLRGGVKEGVVEKYRKISTCIISNPTQPTPKTNPQKTPKLPTTNKKTPSTPYPQKSEISQKYHKTPHFNPSTLHPTLPTHSPSPWASYCYSEGIWQKI